MGAQRNVCYPRRAEILSVLAAIVLLAGTPAAVAEDGVVLWFTSLLRVKGVSPGKPVTLCITNQQISWREGKTTKTLKVPDSKVAFKPWQTASSTSYGRSKKIWDTSHPPANAGADTFMGGVSLPLPAGLPRGMSAISWQGKFETDGKSISVQWRWAVLGFTHFMDDYNDLEVAPSELDLGRFGGKFAAGMPVRMKDYIAHLLADDDDGVVFLGTGARNLTAVPIGRGCGGAY